MEEEGVADWGREKMGLWGDGGAAPMTPGRVQGTLHPRARPKAAPVRHATGEGRLGRRGLLGRLGRRRVGARVLEGPERPEGRKGPEGGARRIGGHPKATQPPSLGGSAAGIIFSARTRGCAKDGGLTPGESGGGGRRPLVSPSRPPPSRRRGEWGSPWKPGHSAREGTDVPGVSADVSRRNRVFAETRWLSLWEVAADARWVGG